MYKKYIEGTMQIIVDYLNAFSASEIMWLTTVAFILGLWLNYRRTKSVVKSEKSLDTMTNEIANYIDFIKTNAETVEKPWVLSLDEFQNEFATIQKGSKEVQNTIKASSVLMQEQLDELYSICKDSGMLIDGESRNVLNVAKYIADMEQQIYKNVDKHQRNLLQTVDRIYTVRVNQDIEMRKLKDEVDVLLAKVESNERKIRETNLSVRARNKWSNLYRMVDELNSGKGAV